MAKHHMIKTICLSTAVCMAVATTAIPAGAAETGSSDTSESIEDMKQKQQDAQESADALEEAKKKLEASIGDMNSDLGDIGSSIEEIQDKISETEAKITESEQLLADAQAVADKQYADMKKRIQFMYENSDRSIWITLLEAGSFAEFVNRVQYIADVSAYDRNMLNTYQETQQTIASYKDTLEQQKTELLASQEELKNKENDLNQVIASRQSELEDTSDAQQESQQQADQYADQIAAMEEFERQMEEQKAAEDAANMAMIKQQEEELRQEQEAAKQRREEAKRQQQAQNEQQTQKPDNAGSTSGNNQNGDNNGGTDTQPGSGDNNGSDNTGNTTDPGTTDPGTTNPGTDTDIDDNPFANVSESEVYLLACIIDCESEGEPYAGQLAVGSVVLNRVESKYFPDTITGVIYQKNQFSPVASGRLAYMLNRGPTASCMKAAKEVLGGNRTVSCLYFRVNTGVISGTVIGHHVFY